jgi:hypothetical protein
VQQLLEEPRFSRERNCGQRQRYSIKLADNRSSSCKSVCWIQHRQQNIDCNNDGNENDYGGDGIIRNDKNEDGIPPTAAA